MTDPRTMLVAVFLAREDGHDVPTSGDGIEREYVLKAASLLAEIDAFDALCEGMPR